jgi:hypothetical protein
MVSPRLWLAGVVSQTRDTKLADRLLQQVRACGQAACERHDLYGWLGRVPGQYQTGVS